MRYQDSTSITTRKSISVFFPCFNDSKSIGHLIDDAFEVLKKLTNDYEVIVVEDGSSDNSREVLQKKAGHCKKLRLIFHKKNKGYGGALKSGFKNATKELVFYTDGDSQYDIKELPLLVSLMTDDVSFVNGIKMERQDAWIRITLGNMYRFLVRWIFWLPIVDADCDFRLIRKSLLDRIHLKSNSGSICVELVKKAERANGKFRQVSVHHYERRFGKSQFFRISKVTSTFIQLVSLWVKLMVLDKIAS